MTVVSIFLCFIQVFIFRFLRAINLYFGTVFSVKIFIDVWKSKYSEQTIIAKELHLKLADDLARPGNINLPPTLELPVFTDKNCQNFNTSAGH